MELLLKVCEVNGSDLIPMVVGRVGLMGKLMDLGGHLSVGRGIPKQIMINTLWNPLLTYRSMMECNKQFVHCFLLYSDVHPEDGGRFNPIDNMYSLKRWFLPTN